MNIIDVIDQVLTREVGYSENPPNSNRTKYATLLDTLEHPPLPRQGSPWCGTFIDWGYRQAGAIAALPISNFWTNGAALWYKAHNRWTPNKPVRGMLAYRALVGEHGHVGFILDVNGNNVRTVEGNTSATNVGDQSNGGIVAIHIRPISWWEGGYGQPFYELVNNQTQGDDMQAVNFVQYQPPGASQPLPAVWVSSLASQRWVHDPAELAALVAYTGFKGPIHIATTAKDFLFWGQPTGPFPDGWPSDARSRA